MPDQPHDEQEVRLVTAWQDNAAPWAAAVRERRIGTRTRVTDAAVVDAIRSRSPASVLDIGCGEGWLSRALSSHGIGAIGIDAVPALVALATEAGGDFRVMPYDRITLDVRVDVAVANFSLLGRESVDAVLAQVPALLTDGGALIVQTVHPWIACADQPYVEGWREGSWAGFGPDFAAAPPWYFRTTASWVELLHASGLRLVELREPVDPASGKPASLLLVAERADVKRMGKQSRGVDLASLDDLDERQAAAWMRQACAIPGFGKR